jgi:transposase
MCLQANSVITIPEETARVARAAFPRGNPYLRLYDEFGQLFHDSDFQNSFPRTVNPPPVPLVSPLSPCSNSPRI